jgi:two-component system sensor histidine kinase KdpD
MGVLVGVTRTAMERKELLEKAIHNERDELYGILQRMKDGVIIIGADYKIVYLNPAMISEFGRGIGLPCYEYLNGLTHPCGDGCHLRSILIGRTERWEYDCQDGRTFEIVGSPFVDSADIVSALAIFRNITQRKQMETELRNLNELKSDLLSNVSHELRSPLTSIKGIISSLLQKEIKWDDDTRNMLLSGISEETDRLSSLVTNLLNMSKLEAGAWQPELEACHLENIINDTVEYRKWVGQNHRFLLDIKCSLPEMRIDSNQIKQVLHNLLENAEAYSPEGSNICITVSREGEEVKVEIKDEGEGISDQDTQVIFEKFHRGSQKRLKPGGVGLGLSICKSIVEAHGGRIGVKSELRQGSNFYFFLPLRDNREGRNSE